MTSSPRLLAAQADVAAARAQLFGTLGEVQQRLKPSTLTHNAIETATQGVASAARKGAEAVRTRPYAVAAFAGAVGLVMARGWIFDIVRGRRRGDATGARTTGLNNNETKRARHAKKGKQG
ncbi:MAG: hypothetical protein J7500_08765 [Sphingomonas sp.]|uniref:hypothetical protein n=1 Tax=Sphingomonas sp. TaxID=28214 RepID=UPI001B24DC1A|nr:hypothetical protein [Sphingomonas sp.]MBO9622791.1 hypothetical protein [Sphingomonas sp.]